MSFDLGDYNDVPSRLAEFREKHPEGSLQPVDPTEPFRVVTVGDKTFIAYSAAAYRSPDDPRPGIGTAWEPFPGKTSYTRDSELQNAETSAWGRAVVAALAADAKKGIASREEVQSRREEAPPVTENAPPYYDRIRSVATLRAFLNGLDDHSREKVDRLAKERGLDVSAATVDRYRDLILEAYRAA